MTLLVDCVTIVFCGDSEVYFCIVLGGIVTGTDRGKEYKYVCVATNQPETKANPNARPNPTIKQ